jgi:septal ring factor EnvC (AmiA/AmiB activator)
MAAMDNATLDDLQHRISRGQRAAIVRTAVLSFGIVAVAALFLWFTLRELSKAQTELAAVETRIAEATAAQKAAEDTRDTAERQRAEAEGKLKDAQAAVSQLTGQVADLQKQTGDLQARLKAVLDLDRYAYKLDWRDLKRIAAASGNAYQVLEVIERQRQDVHWGMSNTPAGGYNSPFFRDYEQKPFVVGMTPFGVTALNYDFGVKPVAVLRTGLERR